MGRADGALGSAAVRPLGGAESCVPAAWSVFRTDLDPKQGGIIQGQERQRLAGTTAKKRDPYTARVWTATVGTLHVKGADDEVVQEAGYPDFGLTGSTSTRGPLLLRSVMPTYDRDARPVSCG